MEQRTIDILGFTVKRESPDHEGASNTQIYPIQKPTQKLEQCKRQHMFW